MLAIDDSSYSDEKSTLTAKAIHNAEYLAMLDRGIAQLEAGKGQQHELIEVE